MTLIELQSYDKVDWDIFKNIFLLNSKQTIINDYNDIKLFPFHYKNQEYFEF